ncbi:MAG: nickel-dependent lactate racemase [Deltaproteobacteria bacterium]|nr:nickel-dependent lactate racemase [Deltaproteobacteria bacterium]
MKIELAYGKGVKILEIPEDNIASIIYPKERSEVNNPEEEVLRSLENPIGSLPLREIVDRYKAPKVTIIVNDITRPVPYRLILPPLMKQLSGVPTENIDFIVATGIHRPQTDMENRVLYSDELVEKYRFSNHDCDKDLVGLSVLNDGTLLSINKKVAEADIVIGTGMITLHYFAGYSGGRKSIVPGVAGRDIITRSHSMMVDPLAKCGFIEANPVNNIMIEGAKKLPMFFIVNVITNTKREIVKVVSGDMEKAWMEGIKACREMSCYPINRKYEVVIASAGGYPKDINVYQAQKALEYASYATEKGGTIVLLAQCEEGYGEDTFEKWMNDATCPEAIVKRLIRGFELGGHKAYAIARVALENDIVLVSSLNRERVKNLFCHPAGHLSDAIKYIEKKHGKRFSALVMPEAGGTFPILSDF